MTSGTTFDYSEIFAKGLPNAIASCDIAQPKYNFILGHTNSETIPVEGLIEATVTAMRTDGPGLSINLHNGGLLGYLPLREFLVHKLSSYRGVDVSVDDILITSGSQTAAVLINTELLEAGDTVIAENWSYVGMLGDLRDERQSTLQGVPVDEEGMRVRTRWLRHAGGTSGMTECGPSISTRFRRCRTRRGPSCPSNVDRSCCDSAKSTAYRFWKMTATQTWCMKESR